MTSNDTLSFSGKKWRPRISITDHYRNLTQASGLEPLFAGILAHRGLKSPQEVEAFLRPRLHNLVDPLTMQDMKKAVERVANAIEQQESIAIFGDYDVDGATSSALMVRYFRSLGQEVRVYIPSREKEGYGPNSSAMLILAEEGIRVVITVDCGATANEALQTARDAGLDVIVTDHHQGREPSPPAFAMVNPNGLGETFPHKNLAGVGVAFYLLMALNRVLRDRGFFQHSVTEPDLKQLLDLVAVGTVADVASLTGLNRPLVSTGLRVASESRNLGIQALKKVARLGEGLSSGQVGFQLGPRINAGGRLGRETLGFTLLSTEDELLADDIAAELEGYNRERQKVESVILKAAQAQIESNELWKDAFGLVVADTGWHPGVIGIVASRIVEKFHRPTMVIALDEEGGGKGSGRSIPGVDLLKAVDASRDFLTHYGGHKAAAGLTLKKGAFLDFCHSFNQGIEEQFSEELFKPSLATDGVINLEDINRELVGRLERLQPFGMGNPEPVVVLNNVQVVGTRILKEHHVKCHLTDRSNNALEALAFRVLPGPLGEGILDARQPLDVAGTFSINRYKNRETVQLIIKDARLSMGS